MPIILHLDGIAEQEGYTVQELANAVGISRVNMSHIKNGTIRAIRFSTLEKLCETLGCQPGDLIEYAPERDPEHREPGERHGPGESP